MKIIWENKYVVFDVQDGPKTMIDSLNTEGNEGWEVAAIVREEIILTNQPPNKNKKMKC